MNIEALPLEVPQHLEVDVTDLPSATCCASPSQFPAGVTVLDDLEETVLATVTQPSRRRGVGGRRPAEGEEGAEAEGDVEAEAEGDTEPRRPTAKPTSN